MIKSGLKPDSQSNGRELEYTILSLHNQDVEQEFLNLAKNVLENKKLYPNKQNGLKRFNTLFETYIKKVYNEYKTVNIYARQLNSENFIAFWDKLTKLVKANPNVFQGRLEPHPADREINSWHIQYVGANAENIEKILAAFAVQEGAEISMEMALGKDIKPRFEISDELDIQNIKDELFIQDLVNKSKKIFIDQDLQQATDIIKGIEKVEKVEKTPLQELRDRLDFIKNKINITNKQQVLEVIKTRKSNKVREIIDRIKNQRE